ncbi:polymorphic toxin type 15 domain-containing protein [Pseudogracilibacillus sp. SE30717A]|uniref:polymorphic toxin type 15 domain-containing protein n=1 Tax=Pseudogracilibacillus sp. SE30717A TaxID=3098293 RepID=UPI00300DD463
MNTFLAANKEFWVSIAALVVIVGAALIFPPAGIALGAIYGTLELSTAVTGKDWVSGREVGTGERWFRGLLAPLDLIPAVGSVKKFSFMGGAGKLKQAATISLKTSPAVRLKETVEGSVMAARVQGLKRLEQTKQIVANKLKKDWDDAKSLVKEASDAVNEKASVLGKYLFGSQENVALEGAGYVKFENSGNIHRGVTRHEVPRINKIEVKFKKNLSHDSEEFVRQLKDQEKAMNELTVDEYLKNRERYIEEGRALEGNAAQRAEREKQLNKKIKELRKEGLSRKEAEKQAQEWMRTKAVVHNPDQIAGGNPLSIGGLGDKRVNSSIGSQWKYRIDILDNKIRESAKNMTEAERKSTYLNVQLIH